ncbi:MAG: tRNA pseudouridine(38-40) synthase TruA [Cytophagaceae bacterium]|nr:tRNA pseudouridine(38-40) synthase TruA [Cytophagaceae bacterium]
MPRYKLTIEYDGSRYNGWQVQKGKDTIQGKFFDACRNVFETEDFEFYGSSRTDAGVHALAQVAHLDVKTSLKPEIILKRLNETLFADINVLRVEKADNAFNARFDAVARSYVYHISLRRSAFGKSFVWWVKDEIDVQKMKEVAKLYTGFKDFDSFSERTPEEKSTTVEIKHVNIVSEDASVFVHIIGSHFLPKMVRRMVGVMAEAGKGNLSLKEIEEFFQEYSEKAGRYTAPPSGLYLERVYYKGEKISTDFKKCLSLN